MARRRKRAGRRERVAPPAAPAARGRLAPGIAAVALAAASAALLFPWWLERSEPDSLLLVTIDTLRADHVGAYGRSPSPTPNLDALAARGARFARVQAPAPLTAPSHATLLTGQEPPVHGVRDNVTFHLGGAHPTLAERLAAAGYRTAAFIGAFPVASSFGFGRGFGHFDERLGEPVPGTTGAERRASDVADAALDWLRGVAADEPFFAWVHFYDPHDPYVPPAPYDERWSGSPYEGEIAFADAQLGRLLDAVRLAGREERTVVAVLADHGEGLGEHGEATHAILAYQSTLAVPFVLAGPGVDPGTTVASRVGLVDALPTLLGLLGVAAPAGLAGRDLGPALRGAALEPAPLYAESLFGRLNCRWSALRVWTEGDWKLIEGAQPELYDLGEDPNEARDLAAGQPDTLRRLRRGLSSAVARMAPGGDRVQPLALSPEQEARLRSLGYAGGGLAAGALDEPELPDPRSRVGLYDRLQAASRARGPELRDAIREAASISERDPDNPFAFVTLAGLAHRAGRLSLALTAYERATALEPDRPAIRHAFGRALLDAGDLERAERELRIAFEQAPASDARTGVSLAEALIRAGRIDEAEPLLDQVLAEQPTRTDALAARGRLLQERGDLDGALDALERAVRSRDPDTWLAMAALRLERGEASAAREAAEQVLAGNRRHPWALALAGHALALEGQAELSRAVLEEAASAGRRRPDAWLALAEAFEALGRPDRAEDCRRAAAQAES